MEKLDTKQVMINLMVKCMLNKNNKSFYISNLTLDKLQNTINGDSEMAEIIFSAFTIAQGKYIREKMYYQNAIQAYIEAKHEIAKCNACPECGCTLGYIPGVACPNCEYVEC